MNTTHKILYKNSNHLDGLKDESISLIVTSPPYPMIEMWDEMFFSQDAKIKLALGENRNGLAFDLMHQQLDKVWNECYRVLVPGGIMCINIGDATRTLNKNFQLFSSHARILSYCLSIGLQNLPNIIWRKTTNSPNKYMGSGMLPPGAYVTLEHEFILIFRKGNKREFISIKEKKNRNRSAFFWEERNKWFSDVWFDLKGIKQKLNKNELRERSAAYPFELVYRLINMFSVYGDVVLDPFLGTGTSVVASIVAGRNSVGIELDRNFKHTIESNIKQAKEISKEIIFKRLNDHINFVETELSKGREFNNKNNIYGFSCISKQEENILFYKIDKVQMTKKNVYEITHLPIKTNMLSRKLQIPKRKLPKDEK